MKTLSQEGIQARKNYYKVWRAKPENKAKAQEYQKKYWESRVQDAESKENAS